MFALYSVGFDRDGRLERLRAIDYFLPRGEENELEEIVRGALKTPQERDLTVRIRVEPAAQPVVRVGRSERCPPDPNIQFTVIATAALVAQHPSPIRIRAVVDSAGHVVGTQMLSPSGDQQVDEWVESELGRHQFLPALIDGIPGGDGLGAELLHQGAVTTRP